MKYLIALSLAGGTPENSVIRIFFLAVVPSQKISGSIGEVPAIQHKEILQRLAKFLIS